jgi:anti-sigma regulatory factor (Ser/Thr protein kinase)
MLYGVYSDKPEHDRPHAATARLRRPAAEHTAVPAPALIGNLELARDLAEVGRARGLVRELLGDEHPARFDVELCLDELIVNSLLHTDTEKVSVLVLAGDSTIRVEVVDAGAPGKAPHMRENPDNSESETGRGLHVVNALTNGNWGSRTGEAGRMTWAQVEF